MTVRNGGLDRRWGRRRLGPGQELSGSELSRAILVDLLELLGRTAPSLRVLVHPLWSQGRATHPSLAGPAWPCSGTPYFPLACQPPSPAQQLVLRTNRPSLAGALARPRKAWVSFDTVRPGGMARQPPPPPPKGCTGSGSAWDSVEGWGRVDRIL